MSDDNRKVVVTGLGEAAAYLFLFLMVLLFGGDPDLHDALIHYFMQAKP